MLDQVLAAPLNRTEAAGVAHFGEHSTGGRCRGTVEAAGVEMRREALISSYTRWARRCDGRRERDQARTVGATSFYDNSFTQTTAGVASHRRGAAAAEKRKQGTSEIGTCAAASDNGRLEMKTSTVAARDGRNDRALVLFSPSAAGASTQTLLRQSLRRARVLRRGDIMNDLSRGVSLARGTSPIRGLPPFFERPPQLEPGVPRAPPSAPTQLTERALAVVTGGHDRVRSVASNAPGRVTGVRAVACATPTGGMAQTNAPSTLEVAGRLSNAFPGEAKTTAAPGLLDNSMLEIERNCERSSLDMILSGRDVIDADRRWFGPTRCSIVQIWPGASGRFAAEIQAGGGDRGRRERSEAGEESLPTVTARFPPGVDAPTGTPGGWACRDITVWTRATSSEVGVVEGNVRNSGPATARQQACASLPSSTEPGHGNTASAKEKQMVVRSSPDRRNTKPTQGVTDGNLGALTQSENDAVATAAVQRLPDAGDNEQQQMIPFRAYGDVLGAGAEHTTAVSPAGTRSGIHEAEAPRPKPRQTGSDQCNSRGCSEGGGRLLLCDALPRADDVYALRPSPVDICVRQRRIRQSASPLGSRAPSRPVEPAEKVPGVDPTPPDGETRMVPYAKPGPAAGTRTDDNKKNGAEGERLHPSLALGEKGGRRWSEPWSNSGGGLGTRVHQQDLGRVEVPPGCARAIVPGSYTGDGVVAPPNAVGMSQAQELAAKHSCLPKTASESRRRSDDTQVPTGAENKISSEVAEVFAQGSISDVADRREGDESRGLGEKVVDHAGDGSKPERTGDVISTIHGGADSDSGELRTPIEQESTAVSPPGTPDNLPIFIFPKGQQPQTKAQPSTAADTENCGLATSPPQERLLLSPPCSSSPLPPETLGESVVNQTELDDAKAATTEPAPAAPAESTTWEDSMTKSTPAPRELLLLSPPCSSPPLPLETLGESVVHQTELDDTEATTTEPAPAAPAEGTTREDSTTKSMPAPQERLLLSPPCSSSPLPSETLGESVVHQMELDDAGAATTKPASAAPAESTSWEDSTTKSTPAPQECLLPSSPCSSGPLTLKAVGESEVHQTEHDSTEAATTEPASAAPAEGATPGDSTTRSTPASSSPAAPPSTGLAPQPPLSSPLPRSPPPLRPKQSAPPTTAIADVDAGAELGSSVELFLTDTAIRDVNAGNDGRVSSARATHLQLHEGHERGRPGLRAAGQGRDEPEDVKRGSQTPACK